MSIHSSGLICMTAKTGSIAIAALPNTEFDVLRLADRLDDVELRQTAWSPDGKNIALTWVYGKRSTIAVYDVESKKIRHFDAGATSFVIAWGERNAITIGKAGAFRSPYRLLGPEYQEPVVPYILNPDTGALARIAGSVESAMDASLRTPGFVVAVYRKNFEYKIQTIANDTVVCTTPNGYYDGSIGIAGASVVALRHNNDRTLREIVMISPTTCEESVLVATHELLAVLDRLKR
jgi:hypothetical protein